MTVKELIAALQKQDPDSLVMLDPFSVAYKSDNQYYTVRDVVEEVAESHEEKYHDGGADLSTFDYYKYNGHASRRHKDSKIIHIVLLQDYGK